MFEYHEGQGQGGHQEGLQEGHQGDIKEDKESKEVRWTQREFW